MGLMEFLRQWQGGRLSAGVVVSVLIHLALIAALWETRLATREHAKRGEPLIVELPRLPESPPPGSPGVPERAPTLPAPARPAPRVMPKPPAPKADAQAQTRSSEPQRPSTEPIARPEPPPRVASAPTPKAAEGDVPSAPIPKAPDVDIPSPKTVERPKPTEPPPSDPPAENRAADVPLPPPQPRVASVPQPSQPPAPPAPNALAALRRGGTGGAGGSGRGRGGIEGEPIPLESNDPRYNDYFELLRRMLQSKMTWPCDRISRQRGDCEDRDEELLLVFGIFKNGQLGFIEVQRPSRQPVYDEFSANVIKLASPFPPVPAALLAEAKPGSTGVPIAVHFRYVYTQTYRMLLMP